MNSFIKRVIVSSVSGLIALLISILPCYAYSINDKEVLVYRESIGFIANNQVIIPVDNGDLVAFEGDLANAICADISTGLEKVMKSKAASSHVVIDKYGEFLNKVANKSVSEMSSDLPYIELNGITFKFNSDRNTKAWIESFIKDTLKSKLKELNNANIIGIYNVKVDKPISLKDFDFSQYSKKLDFCTKKLGPFSGVVKGEDYEIDTLSVHNTGKNYGLLLNSDFADILNKASASQGAYEKVSATQFLALKANIMLPYSVSESPSSFNYSPVTDYGVNLKDKMLYDINSSNMGMNIAVDENVQNVWTDSLDDYVIFTVSDGTFVGKRTYPEYFKYNDNLYPTEGVVDLTEYYGGSSKCTVTMGDASEADDISTYIFDDGLIQTHKLSDNLEDYAIKISSSKLPLKRITAFASTDTCRVSMGEVEYTNFAKDMKPLCKAAGLSSEYRRAFKSVNNNTPLIAVIIGVVLVVIGVGVILIIKKKKGTDSFVDEQDVEDSIPDVTAPTLRHTSRLRGLKNKQSNNVVEFESNGITDDSGVTEFNFEDDEDE